MIVRLGLPKNAPRWCSDLPGGLVVRIRRSHRRGRGSIPRLGTYFCALPPFPPTLYKKSILRFSKQNASAGNRTRAARVAGEHSTTEPPMLTKTSRYWTLRLLRRIASQPKRDSRKPYRIPFEVHQKGLLSVAVARTYAGTRD